MRAACDAYRWCPVSGIDGSVSVRPVRGEQPVFDADMHVQEPPGVWVEFLDPSLRDRVTVGTREQALPIADGRPLIDLPTPPAVAARCGPR